MISSSRGNNVSMGFQKLQSPEMGILAPGVQKKSQASYACALPPCCRPAWELLSQGFGFVLPLASKFKKATDCFGQLPSVSVGSDLLNFGACDVEGGT